MDFSWHPPDTDPPYIYVFGNQWYDVDIMPTYQYRVPGATDKKFMYDVTATLLPDQSKWEIPDNVIEFDYSWYRTRMNHRSYINLVRNGKRMVDQDI